MPTINYIQMSSAWGWDGQAVNYDPFYGAPPPPRLEHPCPPSRSFDEIRSERSYLLNTLQREDHKATELVKKVRDIQESLESVQGQMQRKLKRKLGQAKCAMSQCTKQEKLILWRLGQVTFEIQNKERWNRIEQERLQHWNYPSFQQMHLDARYPQCIPQIHHYQPPIQPDYFSSNYGGDYHPMPIHMPAPEWLASETHDEPCEPTEIPRVVSAPASNRTRSNSMPNFTTPVEKMKRLSMPDILKEGADGEDSKDEEGQYSDIL